ncbi:MAG: gluconokinase [Jatrophihabitans endophyticus]|nr:gluconokinase [Jatrophihabitans endophyticus]
MGVSGSGKTTVAEGLRDAFGWPFQEGDALHPDANIDKMRHGIPLDDEDRAPWLDRCAAWIRERHEAGTGGILTCSALKKRYRQTLLQGLDNVRFLYLIVSQRALQARLEARRGHYMPKSLLPDQLRTLEEPGDDEPVIRVTAHKTPDATLRDVLDHLRP